MITPIITSITREVFDTVPRNDKEGALALGATRSEMITGVVLPHSSAGLTGAVMLGLGRAMGETIAVAALLIGGVASPKIPRTSSVRVTRCRRDRPLPVRVEWHVLPALIGLGVALFAITW